MHYNSPNLSIKNGCRKFHCGCPRCCIDKRDCNEMKKILSGSFRNGTATKKAEMKKRKAKNLIKLEQKATPGSQS